MRSKQMLSCDPPEPFFDWMSILFELPTVDNNLNDTQSGSQPGKKSHNFNFAPQNVKQELNIDLLVRDNARKKTIAIKLHEHH